MTRAVDPTRIRRAEALISLQLSSGQVRQKLMEEYGVSERTAHSYFNAAWKLVEIDDAADRPRRKNQMRMTMKAALQRALAKGDMKAVAALIDRLCKLDGLYAPTEVRLEGEGAIVTGPNVAAMTSGMRRERIKELAAKLVKDGSKASVEADE